MSRRGEEGIPDLKVGGSNPLRRRHVFPLKKHIIYLGWGQAALKDSEEGVEPYDHD
jgi:hypothetical protein